MEPFIKGYYLPGALCLRLKNPAGYCELEGQDGGNVKIASIGLLGMFAGLNLSGYLLTVVDYMGPGQILAS